MISYLIESLPALSILERPEFRALFAAVFAFLFAVIFGRWFIRFLLRRQVLERTEKGDSEELKLLHGHKAKTPTMGGVILLVAVTVSSLIWAKTDNYVIYLLLGVMLALGVVGLVDDLVKLRSQRKGISAKVKLTWQLIIGLVAGIVLYNFPLAVEYPHFSGDAATTVFLPFFESVHFPLGIGYIALVVLITTGASNAVNLTDGLDGLAIGCSILVGVTFVTIGFLSGYDHTSFALSIPHVAGGTEVAVFTAAIVGAGLGFLWFNCHPAQIFMGDTGALALGGTLGLVAIVCKQEVLFLVAAGVLIAEGFSVVLQVLSFKLTGKRIFRCAPLHHHFEFKGWAETKVTVRFWLVAAALSLGSLLALRI